MAQAQVVLTAVDRTQVAINSALRGMKTLERTAKVTGKAINLAFGFFTGTVLFSAFRKITEAAKKTEEGRQAIENLNRTLKDPALVSAANAIVKVLVDGFALATQQIVAFIKSAKSGLISLGALAPGGSATDAAAIIRGQIRNKSMMAGQLSASGQVSSVLLINKEIDALRSQLVLIESLSKIEDERDRERIDAELKAIENAKNLKDVVIQSQKSSIDAMSKLVEEFNNKTKTSIEKTVEEFAAFEAMIDSLISDRVISAAEGTSRMREQLDSILEEVEVTGKKKYLTETKKETDQMTEFAKAAAQNMQSAFADFLFDPFEQGLRGMLASFLNVIRRMIAEAAAAAILKAIFGDFTGGSGPLAAFANAIVGKASGGPVTSNTPYIVGERGPELFVPNSSGSIVPNNKMGGVTVAPVYNIDARGATADLQQALPGILKENNRRIFDELDRRYGIGR